MTNTVTFLSSVGGDNSIVDDSESPTTGLDAGGHATRFVPALSNIVNIASFVVTKALEVAANLSSVQIIANTVASAGALVTWLKYAARTSNTILAQGDRAKVIDVTTAYTQTLTAAATLGDGWFCYVNNSSLSTATIDPNGAELINGATTLSIPAGEMWLIMCNGTGFNAMLIKQAANIGVSRIALERAVRTAKLNFISST